ncbi:hypothetical protein MATL_G00140520 [Megalops atlanticus]|uniref:non-specific serine/threonine protein kinase n=1 Tax=Megalops atlanticus TaxID=7932 RepID=A0A9D3PU62_MEGAT|nr:hypothetical protein MATL_G00140520 [Megalops atlanticus]
MSFRRSMSRSFSGNGRSGSINEEDVPPPSARVDSRNYLHNVRPENRSTLCSVMAQLMEETQPAFETTLKSRAVSVDSNVKFSCVVTGYPVPELTWYKDDMEMDRYCGLPKYEIFRNGNTHTLHIYNCTVEDAAIYQASARNCKGIVSCSGVLEVGTMNEYKIHQRFFAKLKQKASLKKKELEESRRKGKENVLAPPEQLRTISPERPQRKRRSPGEAGLRSPSALHDGEAEAKKSAQEDEAEARLHEGVAESGAELLAAAPEIPNGFPADTRGAPGSEAGQEEAQENGSEDPTYIYEMVEIVTTRRPPKDPLAKKRPKISNGVDGGKGGGSAEQGSGGESEARNEGGMSLAQYLTESSQFEVSKDKQNPAEEVMEVDTMVNRVPAGKETADRQTESLRQVVQSSVAPQVKAEVQPTASKELEPPHSQTPLSSVFFSLRDMFFGRKDNKDNKAEDTPEMAHNPPAFPSEPQPYPQTHQWEREDQTEDLNFMEEMVQMQAEEKLTAGDAQLSIPPPYFKTKEQWDTARMQEGQALKEHVQGDTVTKSMEPGEGKAVMSHLLHEPGGGEVGEDKTRGFVEMTCETPPRPSPLCEDAEEHMQTERNEAPLWQDVVAPLCEVGVTEMFTSAGEQVTTDTSEMNTAGSHGQTAPGALTHGTQPHSGGSGDTSTKTETGPQKWGLEIAGSRDSAHEGSSLSSIGIPQDLVKQKDEQVKDSVEEDSPPENQPSKDEIKEMELLVTLAQGVKNQQDVEVSLQAPEGEAVEKIVGAKESGMTDSTVVVPGEPGKEKQPKETQTFVDQLQKDKPSVENLGFMSPEAPMLSPTTLRRFASKGVPGLEAPLVAVPAIRVDSSPSGEKKSEEGTGVDTPPSVPSCESSPKLKRRDSLTPIPSATPEELASGARRKIFIPKSKGEGGEGVEKEEAANRKTLSPQQEAPYLSPGQSRRAALLQPSAGQQTPPTERRSPLLGRKKATLEVPKRPEEVLEEAGTTKPDLKPAEEKTLNPFKAPQVIRKIRGEPFPDAVGHLKLWCQFFNVLSDSTIKWCRDEVEIAEMKRSAGDESQVALALVQTSSRDCGVYSCSITNEYGTDMTDFLLSADILSEFLLREDLEVGEEIEMTPMVFTKGLADPGNWGNKLFGRVMTEEAHIGVGCNRKACRMKVIYGLEPIFESGTTCITKVRNPIAYGSKDENNLAERNLEITKQDCKIQNTVREYCKVFSAEARVIENFGPALEVTPLYLMYRPANTIPYATVEADLNGVFLKYSLIDSTGRLVMRTGSEVEQKCCAFQHWIHQWTNGNLLVTQLEGVGMKITNIGIATKSKGYQGLSEAGAPKMFEQFAAQHQCNYYCGLLGLRILKSTDSMQQPTKMKGSRSPLLNRKAAPGSSSPQLQKKGVHSPQTVRKAGSSPKVARRSSESGDTKSAPKQKAAEAPKVGETS